MSDNAFAKFIPCPEHPTGRAGRFGRKHQAILFCYPGGFAGIWECPVSGASDSCEHEERHIESVQVDYWPTPDIDSSYDVDVYVCDECGVTIDLDVANPAEDAFDAMIDSQIDFARGK